MHDRQVKGSCLCDAPCHSVDLGGIQVAVVVLRVRASIKSADDLFVLGLCMRNGLALQTSGIPRPWVRQATHYMAERLWGQHTDNPQAQVRAASCGTWLVCVASGEEQEPVRTEGSR